MIGVVPDQDQDLGEGGLVPKTETMIEGDLDPRTETMTGGGLVPGIKTTIRGGLDQGIRGILVLIPETRIMTGSDPVPVPEVKRITELPLATETAATPF